MPTEPLFFRRRSPSSVLPALLLPLLLTACPSKPDDSGTPVDVCTGDALALTDVNNYAFAGALAVPSIVTASGRDLNLSWAELTQDIQCHDIDPATDIDVVAMIRFSSLTQEEVQTGLSTNDLQQSDMSGYVQFENTEGVTSTNLSGMSFFGTQIDVPSEYVEGGGTYMLMLNSGTTPGVGARMISFLTPTVSSEVTDVGIGTGCGVLNFSADLHSASAVPMCSDGPYTVDWSGVTKDGQGSPFDGGQIDGLMLGFYEGLQVSDIEANFLDLETMATHLWTLDLLGETNADLTLATDGTTTFTGFDGDGVWVLALRCSRCYNPAPLFVAVIDPTAAP